MDIRVIKRAEFSITFSEAHLIRSALIIKVKEDGLCKEAEDSITLMLNEIDNALANG